MSRISKAVWSTWMWQTDRLPNVASPLPFFFGLLTRRLCESLHLASQVRLAHLFRRSQLVKPVSHERETNVRLSLWATELGGVECEKLCFSLPTWNKWIKRSVCACMCARVHNCVCRIKRFHGQFSLHNISVGIDIFCFDSKYWDFLCFLLHEYVKKNVIIHSWFWHYLLLVCVFEEKKTCDVSLHWNCTGPQTHLFRSAQANVRIKVYQELTLEARRGGKNIRKNRIKTQAALSLSGR